ncbi:hypothetical protein [Glutamicibacter halophytocola]|uniref:Immunity repressor n=1 Tax=Glutamicibacter halophytocola TaxID=1933880 RepID=A0AA95BSJ2_9MICC|nr:hypothetical protein [Glutamicibacter halophytocola]UUX60134.1 hypothetical protein NUH22_05860 [Glutamicibacter halophytocola]
MVVNETDSLKGLVELALRRHDTSARQLAFKAQEGGHKITYTTLNHIRNNTYKSAPGAVTLRAIAFLAGVEDSVAFAAAGQPVPGPPLADELPSGADNLSPKARKTLIDLARLLIEYEADNDNAQHTSREREFSSEDQHVRAQEIRKPEDTKPSHLRAVAPEGDTRPGQKNDPEYSITELHGEEARNIPVPPREQLAAHPKVKTIREKLDDTTDECK